MKQVILNEQKLTGLTVYETAPIGMPMIWLTDKAPVGFLFFDGKEYNKSDFPELYEVVKNIPSFHSETEGKFKIPNLKDRVLQGADTVIGQLIEAGLPNITGKWEPQIHWGSGTAVPQSLLDEMDGVFSAEGISSPAGYFTVNTLTASTDKYLRFNAKGGETKTNGTLKTADEPHVYGNSDTVQPSAFTVRYIIKATNYIDLPQNAIDDTKTTNANAWSAEKVNGALTEYQKHYRSLTFSARISATGIVAIPEISTEDAIIIQALCTSNNDTIARIGHYSTTFWVQVIDYAGNIFKDTNVTCTIFYIKKE